jgi:tetratricopeptide (TPR) repeat protein
MVRRGSLFLFPLFFFSCSLTAVQEKPTSPIIAEEVKKPPSKKEKAEGYYQIGVAYLKMGEIPLSLNYLMKAYKLNPKDPKIPNAIGLAFLKRGDLKRAEEWLRKALSLKRDFSEAWLNLGILYEERGELEKAREFYLKALENPFYLTPEVAYYRLAELALKEGDRSSAEKYLKLALRNNPDFIPAYLALGELLEDEGRKEEAAKLYLRLISIYPKLQEPYCRLGELLLEKDREAGVKYLKKCISINPSSELAAQARWRLESVER